ncbi:hypothetical protein OEG84_07955 [Hoeflea sp. G2-23]|uniref:Autotransporter domain-containing protein n=1 Tax=Hoeflea algicola TaxID=2983763 RepID=A0ABT3Z8J7_9HYPH|nr:hypothetical protein [Hoeflea algicola]MCY0147649.1 hypothetical protein [Hoeflea algicola]
MKGTGVSDDGSVVIGNTDPLDGGSSSHAMVWTEATGFTTLGGVSRGILFKLDTLGISGDGTVFTGTANNSILGSGTTGNRAYRWTSAGGFQDLGSLGSNNSSGLGISADGNVIVGSSYDDGGRLRAMRWTSAAGMLSLGQLDGDEVTANAYATSGDGAVAVGISSGFTSPTIPRAFSWTEATGMVALQTLGGGSSNALDVSYDGRVIGGSSQMGVRQVAVRWVDGVVSTLGQTERGSIAYGVSGNGQVLVGDIADPGFPSGFRWDETSGLVSVEQWLRTSGVTILDGSTYTARATNCDGSVVVGSTFPAGFGPFVRSDLYIARGNGTGPSTCSYATDTSGSDGAGDGDNTGSGTGDGDNTGGGTGNGDNAGGGTGNGDNAGGGTGNGDNAGGGTGNGDNAGGGTGNGDNAGGGTGNGDNAGGGTGNGDNAGGGTGNGDNAGGGTGNGDNAGGGAGVGLITLTDLNATLGNAAATNATTVNGLGLLLNGAGSRPLDRRAPEQRNIAWVGGDLGRDDHGTRDGSVALGEVGVGRNIGAIQLNGAIGVSGNSQSSAFGGTTDVLTTYAKLETIGQLYATDAGSIWGVLTGTALIGGADITRNYRANGGLISTSRGKTDVSGFGIRGRLQLEGFVPFFSPYVEGSHARACMAGYTETGGAFPASFNRLCDTSTEARIGMDARIPVTETFNLIGTLEAVHRFESAGSNATGQVVGLGAFNLTTAAYEQDWARAGLGVEAKFGDATFSVVGNVTSSGETANAWVGASVRTAF